MPEFGLQFRFSGAFQRGPRNKAVWQFTKSKP